MNPTRLSFAWLTLAVLMTQPAWASRPSPRQLAQDQTREARMEKSRAEAAPWRDSLAAAFAGLPTSPALPDSAATAEAVRLVFLTTYKHHGPAGTAKPAGKSAAADSAASAASLAAAWTTLASECRAAKLAPLEMAEAIYRFTNSDWAPVSVATGPGLDKVKTATDYLLWGRAVIATGKKALASNAVPAEVWSRQAASYKVRKPADLAKVGINPPPVRF